MASIEQRSGSWRVYWRSGGRTGKQSTTWPTERHARQAKEIAEAHRHRITSDDVYRAVLGEVYGQAIESVSMLPTVGEWAETWLSAKNRISPGQRQRYRRQLDTRILPVIGHVTLDRVTGTDIGKLLAGLRTEVKDSTATRYYAVIHSLFGAAVRDRLIPDNPAKRTDFVRDMVRYDDTGDEGHVYLTPGQVDQLCSGMDGPTATIVRLLVGTGCRWSEITAVPVSSVDLLARTPVMRITRAWKRDGCARWYLGTTKGRQKRTLTLGAALVDLLATLVAGEPGDAMIAALAMRRMGKPYVVREKGGERLDYDAWRSRRWEPAVRAMMTCSEHPPEKGQKASTCECPTRLRNRPTIHDLRHTHAAWLISAGVPLPAVQRRLGHQNITTTIETYGGLMPEVDTALVAAIDQAMGVTAQVNGLI